MKKPIAILDQFIEKGRTITYMTAFDGNHNYNDGRMPNSIAVFKVYLKESKSNFFESVIPRLKMYRVNKWASRHLIASQINHRCS